MKGMAGRCVLPACKRGREGLFEVNSIIHRDLSGTIGEQVVAPSPECPLYLAEPQQLCVAEIGESCLSTLTFIVAQCVIEASW
mmetsp:Transcript_16944/g.42550  ORF Transcript_16944/g.42550 Transcript_16944/m.42550 type:complete len:83 (+) Transcript_16944:733-981(+)